MFEFFVVGGNWLRSKEALWGLFLYRKQSMDDYIVGGQISSGAHIEHRRTKDWK